jgi:hypothetical protein
MKEVTLNTSIDIESLIDFYKDANNEKWGNPEYPCNADSFSILTASNSTFTGPDGRILIMEQDCRYTWQVRILNETSDNWSLTLNNDGVKNIITMEMVQKEKDKSYPDQKEWEKLFVWDNNLDVDQNGRLRLSEEEEKENKMTFVITTQPSSISREDINYAKLSYSINFKFTDYEGKARYGNIDPFIKVRSDDPVPQP